MEIWCALPWSSPKSGIEIRSEGHHDVRFIMPEHGFDVGGRRQFFHDRKITVFVYPLRNARGDGVFRRIEHGHAAVVEFGGDGKTEQNDLQHRHAQQNQHRPPVAEDVEKFYLDKSPKLFHLY